ncbi:hypothetical protein [Streptomyces sp. V4I2]|uniref:hypothetical protein n=1 Tax=Streptomyces sp. V4I2 TaxID=3042280 RepID=UPI00278733C1|nr:hypothetical protein [Streptomyces sp. V4I2]MDQ1049301.1 beta-xylosidase [Streptomyces sp. V4I2]
MSRVPAGSSGRLSGAWRFRVGTGRLDLALVTRHGDGRVTVLARAPVDASGETPGSERHAPRRSVPVAAREAFVRRSLVDEEHGNARTAWQRMAGPRSPRPHQIDVLHEAAEPARPHLRLPAQDGRVDLDLTPSRHEVTLVEVTPVEDEAPPWTDERRPLGKEPQ